MIHVNNDFGVNMVQRVLDAPTRRSGGQIISVTPYNPSQASYQPEVTRALGGNPDALYLVSYPGDGTTIARTWISQGGVKKFLLNDGMNSAKFIADVGPQHLNDAFGTSSGTTKTPSTEYFAREYPPFSKFDAGAPAADRSYDAAAILGLAIAQAGKAESAGDPRRHAPRARSQGHGHPRRRRRVPQGPRADQGRQADPLRRGHRPRAVRPLRRHHRPLPPVAHPERRGEDGRRDVGRRGGRAQGASWASEARPRLERHRRTRRSPATRVPCASATGCSSRARRPPGPTARWPWATPRPRRASSSIASSARSPSWARPCATWCARASSCGASRTGRRWPASTASGSARASGQHAGAGHAGASRSPGGDRGGGGDRRRRCAVASG